ncbi:MAG TPA: PIG-L deacetylase family protein [Acidimicrobiales bacterium]|nr:PIG-L deacetylase family protein [Acidimicrobiales bacterium]
MTTARELAASAPRRAARASKPVIRRVWRRAVLARSVDETAGAAARSAVVVAPHPDDETLGCGATIARKRAAGTRVVVVVVTDGRLSHRSEVLSPDDLAAVRAGEVRAACARLGVEARDLRLLELEEGSVAARHDAVTAMLATILDEVRPDDVLTTYRSDWHVDHQAVSAATAAAVRAAGRASRVLEFPIWFWVDGPWGTGPDGEGSIRRYLGDPVRASRLRTVSVRTDEHLAAKRAALAQYRSQTTNLTGERNWAVMDEDLLSLFLAPVEVFVPFGGPAR